MSEDEPDEISATAESLVPPPLPFGVKLAAGLLILAGLDGIADIILAILGREHEGAGLNLIFLPIGFGLLRRSSNSLGCATALFGLLTLALIIGAIASVIHFFRGNVEFESSSISVGIGLAIMIALTTVVFYLLRNPDAKAAFSRKPLESTLREANHWGWAFVIILGLAISDFYYRQFKLEEIIEGTFAVDTVITAIDAKTRQPLEGVSLGTKSSSQEQYRPHVSFSSLGDDSFRLRGFAFYPVHYEVGADGYGSQKILIDTNSPRTVVVSLEPAREPPKDQPAEAIPE